VPSGGQRGTNIAQRFFMSIAFAQIKALVATETRPQPRAANRVPIIATALVVDRIESEEALAAMKADWTALELSSGNSIPFRTFTWIASWWKHMRRDGLALKDSLAIRTVRTANGRLVGVAPLILTDRPAVGPIRARCLQFIGPDPNMTEVRGLLCEPALGRACYAAIREELERSIGAVDWLRWSGMDERHGAREVFSCPEVRWSNDVVCYVVELPASWEELRSSRPRNLKESLRKCYNSLRRDGLDVFQQVVSAKADVAPALEDFFRLHTQRAQLEGTVDHSDVFGHPARRAFLVDVCERFAERGALRIFRLHVGGALAATRIGFVLGDCLYLYYSGFDPAYAKYSVMTTCVAEAIKFAIAERLRWVNLSTGEDASKLRWHPQSLVFHEGLLMANGAIGRAKYEVVRAVSSAIMQRTVRQYMRLLLMRGSGEPATWPSPPPAPAHRQRQAGFSREPCAVGRSPAATGLH
jgi:CelD/BcsL family acetyltransferase involved in cellulose biosynthesis